MNDPDGFFVRYAPMSGGILLDMSVHDIDGARWLLGADRAKRVYATGTIAIHEGLADCNDVDNAVAIIEFEGGSIATIYASRTYAHGHESMTEVLGTAGRLAVGANPRLNRVEIADVHGVRNECTPTFYERFEEAFLRESDRVRRAGARGPAAAAIPRRRDRGDADRHRAHRVAALAPACRSLAVDYQGALYPRRMREMHASSVVSAPDYNTRGQAPVGPSVVAPSPWNARPKTLDSRVRGNDDRAGFMLQLFAGATCPRAFAASAWASSVNRYAT